ncbi:diheme cytochrome c [Limnohabitans sp. T6-5]|uniref:diheme cytochrome c n=1 Tax=Limnohabitans sp. T6-5 TaxID=1100724 RepID=UPI000D3716C8|nr:diheme cytochrome c [Limnohabitans sp. T6-5]
MHSPILQAIACIVLSSLGMSAAHADGARMPAKILSSYTVECAACHTAYPPGMLPAKSWQRIMKGLDQHYGSDASLDAKTVAEIGQWLQTHAGTYKRVSEEPPQDRLTKSAWFERKHRNISSVVWSLPSVKSAANCAACHTGTEQGFFDDDHLQRPAGLSAHQTRAGND